MIKNGGAHCFFILFFYLFLQDVATTLKTRKDEKHKKLSYKNQSLRNNMKFIGIGIIDTKTQ